MYNNTTLKHSFASAILLGVLLTNKNSVRFSGFKGEFMIKRVLIAGGRDYINYPEACEFIDSCLGELKNECEIIIVSGCCRGADMLGLRYATEHGYQTEKFPADWETLGKSAGPIRNREMAKRSDIVICFWDGTSRGTKSMIEFAKKLQKTVYIKSI